MLVLGIETSCDETGVALYDGGEGRLLAHAVHSQVAMHEAYGGVVPELASRDHIQRLVPLTRRVLEQAARGVADLDGIGYTEGPGLPGRAGALGACRTRHARALPVAAADARQRRSRFQLLWAENRSADARQAAGKRCRHRARLRRRGGRSAACQMRARAANRWAYAPCSSGWRRREPATARRARCRGEEARLRCVLS